MLGLSSGSSLRQDYNFEIFLYSNIIYIYIYIIYVYVILIISIYILIQSF